jgi:hypothetical protein
MGSSATRRAVRPPKDKTSPVARAAIWSSVQNRGPFKWTVGTPKSLASSCGSSYCHTAGAQSLRPVVL